MAGEASADLHGSNLVNAMKNLDPGIVFWGIGGDKMRQAGVETFITSSDMAVVGLTEVLYKLQTIVKAAGKLKSVIKKRRPDLLILIDYPDFNIHIAKTAKHFQVPVLYYISPQVWAWRQGRIKKISRRIDRMAVILPFEKSFYRQKGVEVDYVGHPLMDACPQKVDKETIRAHLELDKEHLVVGLLPGSRKEEIKKLLPVMIKSAEIMSRRHQNIRYLLPIAPTIDPEFVQPFINNSSVKIKVIREDIYEPLSVCDAAIVASGTATLEMAVMGVPMVIIYRMSPLSYWAGRMIIKLSYIGLANHGKKAGVVPELIQGEVTPVRLAHETLNILENKDIQKEMKKKLENIKKKLGMGGASERTAEIALEMMERRQPLGYSFK